MRRVGWITCVALWCAVSAWTGVASAQLKPGSGRFSLDAELLSAGRVHIDPKGGGDETTTSVIGVGANQLGSSRAYLPSTQLGLGAGYVLDRSWVLGLRLGFGYDWLSPERGPNERVVAVSAVPKLTYVSGDDDDQRAKFFIDLGPLVQYNRVKAGGNGQNVLAGGFEVGLGLLRFVCPSASLDLGAYFQGRFGRWDVNDAGTPDRGDAKLRDLRGVIRLGGSLWSGRREPRREPDQYETRPPPPPPTPATLEPPRGPAPDAPPSPYVAPPTAPSTAPSSLPPPPPSAPDPGAPTMR